MKKYVLLAVIVAAVTLRFYVPARLSMWVALGRSLNCPLENALRGPQELKDQIAEKDRILAASKLLETDPGGHYKLYDTPDGKYWIPTGSEYVLPFNLAEQQQC